MKLLTLFLLVLSSLEIGAFAQTDIDLAPADSFALLGASGITNVSAHTYIIGDVGSFPTASVTGFTKSQVNGHLYLKASCATTHAQTGLTVGYNQAANAPCGNDLTGKDLGGLTLGPGCLPGRRWTVRPVAQAPKNSVVRTPSLIQFSLKHSF